MNKNAKVGFVIAGVVIAALLFEEVKNSIVIGEKDEPSAVFCDHLRIKFRIQQTTSRKGGPWDILPGVYAYPDPKGVVKITKPYGTFKERIDLRNDAYEFSGNFFQRDGITLKEGSTVIDIWLADADKGKKNDWIDTLSSPLYDHQSSLVSDDGYFTVEIECI